MMKANKLFILISLNIISNSLSAFPDGEGVVPIDGGLGALLIAGGALGYRAFKKNKEV